MMWLLKIIEIIRDKIVVVFVWNVMYWNKFVFEKFFMELLS